MVQKSRAVVLIVSENSALVTKVRGLLAESPYTIIEWPLGPTLTDILPSQDNLKAIICDILDDGHEIDYLSHILKTQAPLIPFIALIEEGSVRSAVKMMQHGARTALTKPIDKESLLLALNDISPQPHPSLQRQTVIQQAIQLLQSLNHESVSSIGGMSAQAPKLATPTLGEVIQLNDLKIDLIREKAFYQDMVIDLTVSQFRLLSCLAESNKHIVPYEDLYFCLHNIRLDRAAARRALSAHLSYLRTKLSDVGCEEYLVNIRGRGYLLDIPTEEIESTDEINLILEQIPLLVWTTNPQLRLTAVLGVEHLYPDKPLVNQIGSSLEDFLQLISLDHRLIIAHQQALMGETSHHKEILCDRTFHIRIQPYLSHDDKIIGCIGIALDTGGEI